MNRIWSIKYAPQTVEESKINLGRMKERLINMDAGLPPHLILSGPVGSGKLLFAKLWAKSRIKGGGDSIRIVSAETSLTKDERKLVKVKRSGKLGSFQSGSFGLPKFLHARCGDFIRSRPMQSPYKILIVREFHKLRKQESFRRIMERRDYSHCRMIFTTHNSSSILDPIASRCIRMEAKKMHFKDFNSELRRVGKGEEIKIPLEVSKMLYSVFNGNIGASINALQLSYIRSGTIEKEEIREILKITQPPSLIPLIQSAFDRSLGLVKKQLDDILKFYDPMQLYVEISNEIASQNIEGLGEVLCYLANNEMKLINGNDQRIQLLSILMNI